MVKKPKKKKKAKSIEEIFNSYDEFMKVHEHNGATKKDFEKAIKKVAKPSSK